VRLHYRDFAELILFFFPQKQFIAKLRWDPSKAESSIIGRFGDHANQSFQQSSLATGSSQGQGEAIARKLHECGASVVLNYFQDEAGSTEREPKRSSVL